MNCIIVEDDELTITAMKKLVSKVHYLNLIGTCYNPTEAINLLNENKVDLMFLDIEMPEMNGLELLNTLVEKPLTILATSKEEYAIKAFEHNVVDYLLKPVSIERFFKAVAKAKTIYDNFRQGINGSTNDPLFVKSNGTLVKLNINEILWIDASGDYMTINTLNKKHVIHTTMKLIEEKLPSDKFIRIHRSYLISIDNISTIDDNIVVIGKQLIPIGAVYKENLRKRLNLL